LAAVNFVTAGSKDIRNFALARARGAHRLPAMAYPTEFLIRAAALAAVLVAPSGAFADDKGPSIATLPGVEQPEPTIPPLPQGEPLTEPDRNGWVRTGNWDVKISGSVRLDVGAGDLGPAQSR